MAIYACSDFHGMLHFYDAIKEELKPEDKVYFLGDAGDRGPHPWETIKKVLSDPQFIYIKGNHEFMLHSVLTDYFSEDRIDSASMQLLVSNGGEETFDQAIRDPDVRSYISKLKNLPTLEKYVNTNNEVIYLSHAGFTPWKDRNLSAVDLLWDRDHYFDAYLPEECEDCIIIHGHTPVPYLLDDIDPRHEITEIEPGAFWYDVGRKCCIDCGAVFTGYCTLLNLDTWDEEVFYSKPYIID